MVERSLSLGKTVKTLPAPPALFFSNFAGQENNAYCWTLNTNNLASYENSKLVIPIEAYSKPIGIKAFARNRLDMLLKCYHPASHSLLREGYWVGWRARGRAPKKT